MSPDAMPSPPSSPSDEAKARAARMAAFSAKVLGEEETPVAVRSFSEAREGAAGERSYDARSGRVEGRPAGASAGAPAPAPPARPVDDDQLLRDIDAAVADEESRAPPSPPEPAAGEAPSLPSPRPPAGLSPGRLRAMMAAAAPDPAPEEGASPPRPALPDLGGGDLLDEIEAAVDRARSTPAPPPPAALSARRLAAMAQAAAREEPGGPPEGPPGGGPAGMENLEASIPPDDPRAEAPLEGPAMPDTPFSVRADKREKADSPGKAGSPDVVVKKDGRLEPAATPSRNPAEEKFGVRHDKPEAAPPPKIKGPGEFQVAMDKTSTELAESATKAAIEDVFGSPAPQVRHDAPPKPPKAVHVDLPAAAVRRDAPPRTPAPRIQSPGDEPVQARVAKEHREAPRLRSPAEAGPVDVRRDAEPKPLPRMRNAAEEGMAVRRDAEPKPLPRLRSPADAADVAVRRDAEPKPLPRMRSSADADEMAVRKDKPEAHMPALRSPADTMAPDVRRDRIQGQAPRLRSLEASDADVRKPSTFRPPAMRTSEADVAVRQDAEAKPLPRIRSPEAAEAVINRPSTFRPPSIRVGEADVAVKRDAQAKPLPRIVSPADQGAEIHKPSTFRGPTIRASPADVDPLAVKQDREDRDNPNLHNPGQGEFEVRYEHESVWTTKPKRDANP